ncbi:hypothetical protein [Pseudomonas sp. UMAB-40]|uniref:hypothetical protein n=1 Tax=Pseudomonas sp. UMAB-40 TaxID=1365407 RepID=UPI001C589ED0|nr:hypothetical protein [Pseudomonas sp. UMAB-40]
MPTPTQTLNALRTAGFTASLSHPLVAEDGGRIDPCAIGFVAVHTGGGCMALRRQSGEFYMLITSEDGSAVPDLQEWEDNLIGVYRESDDEEIACVTALEWQEVIRIEATATGSVA